MPNPNKYTCTSLTCPYGEGKPKDWSFSDNFLALALAKSFHEREHLVREEDHREDCDLNQPKNCADCIRDGKCPIHINLDCTCQPAPQETAQGEKIYTDKQGLKWPYEISPAPEQRKDWDGAMWKSRKLADMTRNELIEAVCQLGELYERELNKNL